MLATTPSTCLWSWPSHRRRTRRGQQQPESARRTCRPRWKQTFWRDLLLEENVESTVRSVHGLGKAEVGPDDANGTVPAQKNPDFAPLTVKKRQRSAKESVKMLDRLIESLGTKVKTYQFHSVELSMRGRDVGNDTTDVVEVTARTMVLARDESKRFRQRDSSRQDQRSNRR